MTFFTNKLVLTGKPVEIVKELVEEVVNKTEFNQKPSLREAINMKEPNNTVVRSTEIKGESDYVKEMIGDVKR